MEGNKCYATKSITNDFIIVLLCCVVALLFFFCFVVACWFFCSCCCCCCCAGFGSFYEFFFSVSFGENRQYVVDSSPSMVTLAAYNQVVTVNSTFLLVFIIFLMDGNVLVKRIVRWDFELNLINYGGGSSRDDDDDGVIASARFAGAGLSNSFLKFWLWVE